jgi:outer membrane receptor for ferrienterochelin and colicins
MRTFGIIILLFIPVLAFPQLLEGVVYGNEENGKHPLPGVNIFWQGTRRGVASTSDGTFEIEKRNGDHILVFSFVGYGQKEVHVHEEGPLEVVLDPNLALDEVQVVHKNRGTYLSAIDPIQTERINGAELHKAACCNLAESFETNPSVDVSYSDAVTGAKQIRLLGLEGTYSLLQVENMPNLRGLATNFGLTWVPGPWMESIQVSKGAASVLNGYDAIAGQINAEYKKPDSGEKLFLNTYAGASGRLEFNGNGNIRVYKDQLTTGIFLHASDQSRRNDKNNDGFLDEPLSRQIQLLNRWKYNNHKGFMAQAGFTLFTEDRLGGQTAFERGMQPLVTNPYGIDIQNDRLEGFFKTGYVWPNQRTALAWLSNLSRHETRLWYGITPYTGEETRFYGSVVLTRDLDAAGVHMLNTGVSLIYDDFAENLYDTEMKHTEKVPGIFAEYTLKPGENLTFMAGLRTDFHNLFGTFVTPRMHFRYKAGRHVTLRASAGKGYRTANVVSDNNYLLANARPLQWSHDLFQEEAWNYGMALVQHYTLWNKELQLNAEYFRTDFQSQLIVDRETSPDHIQLTPLEGKSYSNSLQFDLRYQPVERLDLLLAYRQNDVKQTIGGELMEKPLTSRYKGLVSLNYTTNLKKWMFDYTFQFNGGGRLPFNPVANGTPDTSLEPDEFSPFTVMNAQVTKYFRHWNIYAGAENLTDFRQPHPVQGADQPFGPEFDATNVWGPVMGRRIYVGLRFLLDY